MRSKFSDMGSSYYVESINSGKKVIFLRLIDGFKRGKEAWRNRAHLSKRGRWVVKQKPGKC